jgi:uncharacterized protein YlxW (UPF0749 family)
MNGLTREEMQATIRANDAEMAARLGSLESKIEVGLGNVLTEMHKGRADTLKWMIGVVVAMQAVNLYLHRDLTNQITHLNSQAMVLNVQVTQLTAQVTQLSARVDQLDARLTKIGRILDRSKSGTSTLKR